MWLLSWIRDGKQHKLLLNELEDLIKQAYTNRDIGMLIEFVPIYEKPSQAPKKEPDSYRRLVPLSDTTYKEEK